MKANSGYSGEVTLVNNASFGDQDCSVSWPNGGAKRDLTALAAEIKTRIEAFLGIEVELPEDPEEEPEEESEEAATFCKQQQVLEAANHPHLKASFDNGHALLFSHVPAADWIKELGSDLAHCHLHHSAN